MENQSQIEALTQKVEALIAPEPGFFLVELRIKPTNNIKVFIDADAGISIDKLVQLNRKLYKELEEGNFYPNGDFSLEVSSPGLDEPLKMFRQYKKNIGRYVEVLLNEGQKIEGKLTAADETEVTIEEEKGKNLPGRQAGKKKEIVQHTVPFSAIKATRIQIKF